MAKARTQAINFKMYRHFAVVTLVATFVLVMFADGANSEAEEGVQLAKAEPAELQQEQARSEPVPPAEPVASGGWGTEGPASTQPTAVSAASGRHLFRGDQAGGMAIVPELQGKTRAEQNAISERLERDSKRRSGS
ncbi:hypothetical protein [Paraurantiacibacter namhicola]|uniref:Uncharacterized protein n=1 Tax=Paraurantiacibacter namhicola TaxID=645517 RepID=A0A1C7D970_9SPHN|nr:hypothetical protein [Paraurantiacibacter namhicola]ANU07861.1 hypothetical protein A6F65_01561 [Paraurantiacibacter namhicola]